RLLRGAYLELESDAHERIIVDAGERQRRSLRIDILAAVPAVPRFEESDERRLAGDAVGLVFDTPFADRRLAPARPVARLDGHVADLEIAARMFDPRIAAAGGKRKRGGGKRSRAKNAPRRTHDRPHHHPSKECDARNAGVQWGCGL